MKRLQEYGVWALIPVLLVWIVYLLCTGCSAYNLGTKVDQAQLRTFHPGHTPCATVRDTLGTPTGQKLRADGSFQRLVYSHTHIAGLRLDSFIRGPAVAQEQVIFDCDDDGILTNGSPS